MHYTQVYHTTIPGEELTRLVESMPKTEIHVHLEGAVSPETIFAMAARNHVELPVSTLEEWKTYYEFRDFDHFIDTYILATACMKTPEDFKQMVVDFMARQASQNTWYSEVFFSAALHFEHLTQEEILTALDQGVKEGNERYGVLIAFIPDISRQACVQQESQEKVLTFALKAKDLGIGIGMGIGGKEIGYPSALFKDVFAEARRQGLHIVAHAGETGDPAVVRDVIDLLRPERIGHGVRSLEEPPLVDALRASQLPLDVSPQSNYCTQVVSAGSPHPIRRMVDLGLNCTVNSDDPAMFSTDLNNEYLTLAAQGFAFDELWRLNLNSLNASFLEKKEKVEFLRQWESWYQEHIP